MIFQNIAQNALQASDFAPAVAGLYPPYTIPLIVSGSVNLLLIF